MKIVDVSDRTELASLLAELDAGEDVLIARDGTPVARLSKMLPVRRTPGLLADSPAWHDFQYDPTIFAPLETDQALSTEGWPV